MSGNTPELSLKTAVDADDTADYLTIALASSLTTVDSLFNNTTGHSHNGAHQGGPITSIPAGAIPDGSITSAKIADGTIATADLANASVTNAKLASDTARANLLTNGGFETWQRGNGPFTANGAFSADRWMLQVGAPTTLSVSRDTANVDSSGSVYCAAVSVGAFGGTCYLSQPLGTDAQTLRGRTITWSLRVKTSTASVVRLRLADTITADAFSSYHTGNGQYQTLSATLTVATNATVVWCYISFEGNQTTYVDNAMLVVGSQAADYAPLHPADDLTRCMRYYETTQVGIGEIGASGLVTAGGVLRGWYYYKAQKPVAPTVTKVGTWLVANCAQPAASNIGVNGVMLSATGTSANTDTYFLTQAGGAALTVEANP